MVEKENGATEDWTIRYLDRRFSDHQLEHGHHKEVHAVEGEHKKELSLNIENSRLELRRMDDHLRNNANEWRGAMDDREDEFSKKDDLKPIVEKLERVIGMQGAFATKDEYKTLEKIVGEQGTQQSIAAGRQQMMIIVMGLIPTAIALTGFIYAVTRG